jgi:hypothetical protein
MEANLVKAAIQLLCVIPGVGDLGLGNYNSCKPFTAVVNYFLPPLSGAASQTHEKQNV